MAAQRWMFTTEQLMNTPSRKCGIDADKELSYRQQAANLIQDMGQRLQVEQLCINTAIVYMHRFYMFRSFTRFPRNEMAPACLFLAAKVEEQPRKLEHVIKVAHACLNRDHNTPTPDPKTEAYLEQAQQLVINENILLQTLGFEVTVDHPHTHVVKASTVILAKASKDLSKTSYYLATNSLHMTTMCLQHRPTVVACVCIYMACRWANYKIPRSNEGREWFQYIDQKVTLPLIEELYNEFLNILNKSPMKLKRKIMGWKGNEGQAREEERPGQSSSQELNRPSTSTHNKHSSHDQRDGPESNKHNHPDQKQCHEHKDSRAEHKKEHYPEKRPSEHKPMSSSHNPDRKPQTSHPPDPSKHVKREDRHDGHSHSQPHRKEVQHHMHAEYRDKNVTHERHKDLVQVKKEANVNGQNHSSNSSIPSVKPHNEVIKSEHKDNPVVKEEPSSQPVSASTNLPHSQTASGMPSKSKTSIDINEYVKRREQEKIEREKQMEREKLEKAEREKRHEKERIERDKLLKHRGSDTDLLNKTFSEGSGREQTKHRPPKLDISLPLLENHVDQKPSVSSRDRTERPYHVNIKSPIKPHYNITVKSPIKSSDLKQPKVELSKVQITPEKDGADPFSVNINTDPAIRKLIESDKQECGNSIKPSTNAPGESFISDSDIKKEEPELEPGEIIEPEITLNPEHSSAPDFKIKELNYDPEDGLDSAAALRLKQESDASNTPALSRVKTEPSSGSNTPVRLRLPTQGTSSGNSPLKIKISTKGLSSDSNHSSSKHSSPHRHKHKHKDKHKSHKHSRDKERHREKHREKDATSTETNGQPSSLKLSLKLSDIPGGASSERWSVKNKHERHKNRASISDPSLNKSSNSLEPERSQPWSMTDLIPKSGSSVAQSPSRKRRRMPTVDQNTEHPSQTKAAKMGSNRIRRSSSNHSVVSMELSDGEDGQATNGPQEQNTLSLLNLNLMQAIAQTKQKVESLRSQSTRNSPRDPKPQVNRQQSGFDLEGMMWAGSGSSEAPPLPPSHPAPPPPPPDQVKPPPPLS